MVFDKLKSICDYVREYPGRSAVITGIATALTGLAYCALDQRKPETTYTIDIRDRYNPTLTDNANEPSLLESLVGAYESAYIRGVNFMGTTNDLVGLLHDVGGVGWAFGAAACPSRPGFFRSLVMPYALAIFPEVNKFLYGAMNFDSFCNESFEDILLVGGAYLVGKVFGGIRKTSPECEESREWW